MLSSSHGARHGGRTHHLAGVVHIVGVEGDGDEVLAVIEDEIFGCQARALVIDLTDPDAISESATERIVSVLNARQEGHWQVRGGGEDHEQGDPAPTNRIIHDDGREILISAPGASNTAGAPTQL